jgi:hypothetical protein
MAAPFSLANLVHQSATTTGTGNFTLATLSGKQTFDTAYGHGATTDVFEYFISSQAQAEWEHGTGHMSDATTLVRDTVWDSSNAGSAVGFSAGTKDVTSAVSALGLWAPRGYIDGLILSNDGGTPNTKLDVAAGICRDGTDAMTIRFTAGKVIDGTTVGPNGLDAGALAASTWYHVFAIAKRDGSAQAALASLSASAPTLPAGYQYQRRIGSFKTDGSAHIVGFIQDGDYFQWTGGAVGDVAAANPGTAAVTRTLTVPTGVNVIALLQVGFSTGVLASNPASILISDLAVNDIAPTIANATALNYAAAGTANNYYTVAQCRTNTSAQVRSRLQLSDANIALNINTVGWIDQRGKNK